MFEPNLYAERSINILWLSQIPMYRLLSSKSQDKNSVHLGSTGLAILLIFETCLLEILII